MKKKTMKETLQLNYVGRDSWDRPVYKDQHDMLWKDISLGKYQTPSLYNSSDGSFDGEPDSSISQEFVIITPYVEDKNRFNYMLLSRMQGNCESHINYMTHVPAFGTKLSKEARKEIIREMKDIYLAFEKEERPEWLTFQEILDFEKQFNLLDKKEEGCELSQ